MSSIFYRIIRALSILFKSEIGSNFSFHSATDFLRKITDRTQKYPALVVRSTKFEQDLKYRSMSPIVTKNEIDSTYSETPIPEICDLYFKCMLFCEGNIEGLETISKIISLFGRNPYIDISDYDTELPDEIPIIPDPLVSYPVIKDSTYNSETGILTLIGKNLVHIAGTNNDIDSTKLTITGRDNEIFTLTILSPKVEIISATSVAILITEEDKVAVDLILDRNGIKAIDGNIYKLTAAVGWNGVTSILNNSRIIVSGVAIPDMTYTRYGLNLLSAEEDNEDNASNISKYEIIFSIEGVEFSTNVTSSGKLTSEVVPDVTIK